MPVGSVEERKQGCQDSVTGVIFGLIIFIVAFWPATCAVRDVGQDSRTIENLPVLTASDAVGRSGLVKVMGAPEIDQPLKLEMQDTKHDIDTFWYRNSYYEWDEGDEGKDGEWSLSSTEESMAGFRLGEIEVVPTGGSWQIEGFESGETDEPDPDETDVWVRQEWLTADDDSLGGLIVVGNISGGVIHGGDPFIITNYSDSQLVQSQKNGGAHEQDFTDRRGSDHVLDRVQPDYRAASVSSQYDPGDRRRPARIDRIRQSDIRDLLGVADPDFREVLADHPDNRSSPRDPPGHPFKVDLEGRRGGVHRGGRGV